MVFNLRCASREWHATRVDFFDEAVSHTAVVRAVAVFVDAQLAPVKELQLEIVLDRRTGHHVHFRQGRVHVPHVRSPFFAHANGRARFAGTEAVIQEQAVVRGIHGEKILHENLVGR